ncbi:MULTISPECIES: hypothetical protein [unclassified Streptomyces]|uniref:hypothetical protein n=1 Tax=unclassified Streptomyces TaxID=2593676 RepID=UPI0033F0CD60
MRPRSSYKAPPPQSLIYSAVVQSMAEHGPRKMNMALAARIAETDRQLLYRHLDRLQFHTVQQDPSPYAIALPPAKGHYNHPIVVEPKELGTPAPKQVLANSPRPARPEGARHARRTAHQQP